MTIYIPWGFIAIFVVLYFFYSVNRKNRLKKEERQDRLKEKQEEFARDMEVYAATLTARTQTR